MREVMSHKEFIDSHTIENRKVYEIQSELDKKGIRDIKERLKYVEENYDGQYYMYIALKEIHDVILKNYHELNEELTIRKTSIDYLLRACSFAITFIPEGLPEDAYDYMKRNSNSFFNNVIEQYIEQGID